MVCREFYLGLVSGAGRGVLAERDCLLLAFRCQHYTGARPRRQFGATVSSRPVRLICRDPARGISSREAAGLWGSFHVYETSEDSLREWVGGLGTARTAGVNPIRSNNF